MRLLLISLFCLFVNTTLISESSTDLIEPARIEDKDGFTNVREEPNLNSEIQYKIKQDHIFWVIDYSGKYGFNQKDFKNWCLIRYYDVSKNKNNTEIKWQYKTGYIHKSRVKLIKGMKEFSIKDIEHEKHKVLSDQNTEIEITFEQIDFTKHVLEEKNKKFTIDGLVPWGIDGYPAEYKNYLNKTIINSIEIKTSSNKQKLPESSINNLYWISYDKIKAYRDGTKCYLYLSGGNASTPYEAIWVFNNNSFQNVYCMYLNI